MTPPQRARGRGAHGARLRRGPLDGQEFEIPPSGLVVGREGHVRVPDEFLSRRHFEVVPEADGTIRVRDLGSRNGTFLNTLPAREHEGAGRRRDPGRRESIPGRTARESNAPYVAKMRVDARQRAYTSRYSADQSSKSLESTVGSRRARIVRRFPAPLHKLPSSTPRRPDAAAFVRASPATSFPSTSRSPTPSATSCTRCVDDPRRRIERDRSVRELQEQRRMLELGRTSIWW